MPRKKAEAAPVAPQEPATSIVTYDDRTTMVLSPQEVLAHRQRIVEVMKTVMVDKVHYGKIGGTSKPTLLKAGAEVLCATFRLYPDIECIPEETADSITYTSKVAIKVMGSDVVVGNGIGVCSSDETKYKWRAAICDAEWEDAPPDRKQLKWKKGWGDKPPYQVKQVRMDHADIANTIAKMSKKRGLVDAVLTATAASDIFTQDMEDLPRDYTDQSGGKVSNGASGGGGGGGARKYNRNPNAGITEPQAKRLYAIAHSNGKVKKDVNAYLKSLGYTKIGQITRSEYDSICEWAEHGEVVSAGEPEQQPLDNTPPPNVNDDPF